MVTASGAGRPDVDHDRHSDRYDDRYDEAMHAALAAAARGPVRGPNPRVGCVLLGPGGERLAEGWHRGAGTAHAEVDALRRAAEADRQVRGATAVVTLEPCSHTGRTPPCTRALIEAGVARVVIGAEDPNPRAAGGTTALRSAGVEVITGVSHAQCEALNARWLHAVRRGRPYVIWKFAATLDGRSAAADGTSRWITGEPARADVHRRRAEADAIVVGTGTVLADDPALTVRSADGGLVGEQPLRVVIGERELPAGSQVLDARAPTLLLRTRDLAQALAELARREIRTVWLEGGPRLAAAFWRAALVDEVLCYLAPALLGTGPAAVADLGVVTMADIARLELREVRRLGDDVLLSAVPARPRSGRAPSPHTPPVHVQEV